MALADLVKETTQLTEDLVVLNLTNGYAVACERNGEGGQFSVFANMGIYTPEYLSILTRDFAGERGSIVWGGGDTRYFKIDGAWAPEEELRKSGKYDELLRKSGRVIYQGDEIKTVSNHGRLLQEHADGLPYLLGKTEQEFKQAHDKILTSLALEPIYGRTVKYNLAVIGLTGLKKVGLLPLGVILTGGAASIPSLEAMTEECPEAVKNLLFSREIGKRITNKSLIKSGSDGKNPALDFSEGWHGSPKGFDRFQLIFPYGLEIQYSGFVNNYSASDKIIPGIKAKYAKQKHYVTVEPKLLDQIEQTTKDFRKVWGDLESFRNNFPVAELNAFLKSVNFI